MAAVAETEAPAPIPAVFPLLGAASFCAFSTRYSLAPLVSVFIAAQAGYTAAQKTYLLSAFFPGYVASMVPGGILASVYGGKKVFSVVLWGHALFAALIPAAVRKGPTALWACLCAIGLCQGPLFGAQKSAQAAWLPSDGPTRARALMVVNLGSKLAGPITNLLVPVIAGSQLGWRSVAYIYAIFTAGFALLWQVLVKDAPAPPPSDGTSELHSKGSRAIDWRIFRVPAVWAPLVMHVAENTSMYAIMQMSPLIYTDVFRVDPAAMGKFLAAPPALNALGAPVIAKVEGYLHRRGVPMLTIQKAAVRTDNALQTTVSRGGKCVRSHRTSLLLHDSCWCAFGQSGLGAMLETLSQALFAATQVVPALRSPVLATGMCHDIIFCV